MFRDTKSSVISGRNDQSGDTTCPDWKSRLCAKSQKRSEIFIFVSQIKHLLPQGQGPSGGVLVFHRGDSLTFVHPIVTERQHN